jgi:hypothetical protein
VTSVPRAGSRSDGRFTRQERLVEVGEEGQARIEAGRVSVSARGFEGWVEGRYLAGAGVAVLVVEDLGVGEGAVRLRSDVVIEAKPPAGAARDAGLVDGDVDAGLANPVAGAYVAASRRSLRALRALLEGDGT